MDLTIEYEKRRRFLEFLEANGLSPESVERILEIAPDVSLSISKLLVEKYGELYKTFIASPKFKYDNKYGIPGVRGEARYLYKGLALDVPKTSLNDANLPRKLFASGYKLPKESDFDTVLIYAQPKIQEFIARPLKIICGEVYKGCPRELQTGCSYYHLTRMYLYCVCKDQYDFIQEYDSQRGETYVLIKNKNIR